METTMRFDDFCRDVTGSPEFKHVKAVLDQSQRFDAATDTGQIARALLYVKKTVYEFKYPELKARKFIPVANDAPAGADTISTLMWDGVGQAKLIANWGDDLPRTDAKVTEDIGPVKSLGIAYAYTVLDLQRAAMSGAPLNTQKAKFAVRGMEQTIDDIAALGNTDSNLGGFLNNATVPIEAATGAWDTATPAEIFSDLAKLSTNMLTATNGIEQPDTIILPLASRALLAQAPYSTLNGQTLLSVFQANNPYITNIDFWYKLDTAGVGGVKRAVAYRRSPEVLTLEMPLEFTQLPPEPRNLEFVVNCWARTGGTRIRYPYAVRFMDGM